MTFSTLGLIAPLLDNLATIGHQTPTPVQTEAIPAVLAGHDVLAAAQTGSGKTAAFALPLLQMLLQGGDKVAANSTRALILVPTRELAEQVWQSLDHFAAGLPLRCLAVYGGVSINPQMQQLRRGVDLLVATPGRLLDLQQHNAVKLDAVATLVLDEADKLLELGFAAEIGRILPLLPARRQNLFFSATFPPAVAALAGRMLQQPLRIDIASDAALTPDIRQRAIRVDPSRRTQLLRSLIQQHGWPQVLVFTASKHSADIVAHKLGKAGIAAASFHGEYSQGARQRILADFKHGKLQVLIATDLAARGIDIAQLPVVVNYDLPRSAVDYTHRIGRTGRAGASGEAISLLSADCEAHFKLIEKRHGLRLEREVVAGFEPSLPATPTLNPVDPDANGGVKGKRKSKKDKLREAAAARAQTDGA